MTLGAVKALRESVEWDGKEFHGLITACLGLLGIAKSVTGTTRDWEKA